MDSHGPRLLKEQQLLVHQDKPLLCTLLNATTDSDAAATPAQKIAVANEADTIGKLIQANLDAEDLRSLRFVSKWFKEWVYQSHALIFSTLYVNQRFTSPHQEQLALFSLLSLAPFCRHLVISFGRRMLHNVPLMLHNGQQVFDTKQSVWMSIFEILRGLATLTISAPGEPDWHAFGIGEALLESIRVALETKLPRGLHNITLSPVNATGLLHFRWRGAAFQETIWTARSFWTRLTHLNIDLHNPLPYYERSNKKDFVKTLHDYLGSFSRSLKVLHFSWLGEAGPNPLLLDLRYGGHNFSSPKIKWAVLEDVVLRNVLAHDGDLVALRRTRIPRLQHFELEDEKMTENEVMVWEEDEEEVPRGCSPLLLFGPLSI